MQQNILMILTAEIANLLRPPKLQSGVLKTFCKAIFGLWRLMLHDTKLRLARPCTRDFPQGQVTGERAGRTTIAAYDLLS